MTLIVRSPADGRTLETVTEHGVEQVASVVARLRAEQPAWEALNVAGTGLG